MKGKGWTSKVLFFDVLLGLGLPFQSWFRNNILLSTDSSYLMSCFSIVFICSIKTEGMINKLNLVTVTQI